MPSSRLWELVLGVVVTLIMEKYMKDFLFLSFMLWGIRVAEKNVNRVTLRVVQRKVGKLPTTTMKSSVKIEFNRQNLKAIDLCRRWNYRLRLCLSVLERYIYIWTLLSKLTRHHMNDQGSNLWFL
ncbi:hypothetical protein SUGI_0039530 [Cryptomeria japonica]|nr:hypothetical protein SUGI_0039530 [Cryptomeria japonica]